jgi:glyoxylase-like metal-dependent hydrolase (beta-lactamase superfamily II)
MLKIKTFIFNPVMENTYLMFDETREAVIIDCGASNGEEQKQLTDFIKVNNLQLKRLLNSHLHFDHVLGNQFILETYGLKPEYHKAEEAVLGLKKLNMVFSPIKYEQIAAGHFIEHEEEIVFGNTQLKAILTPGHSPGSLCFYSEKDECIFTGDTLFHHDIGRTDLLGGNHKNLIDSICNYLFTLPDNTVVYPGHAQPTTIEEEKLYNPHF